MAITITNQSANIKVEWLRKIAWLTKPYRVEYNKDSGRIYIHTDKGPGERAGRTSYFIDYSLVSSPAAASAEDLAELLQGYTDAFSSGKSAEGTFTNADLVGGVLTISHNLGTENIIVVIRDPSGLESITPNTVVDSNTVTVDFGGAIGSGTYTYFVLGK